MTQRRAAGWNSLHPSPLPRKPQRRGRSPSVTRRSERPAPRFCCSLSLGKTRQTPSPMKGEMRTPGHPRLAPWDFELRTLIRARKLPKSLHRNGASSSPSKIFGLYGGNRGSKWPSGRWRRAHLLGGGCQNGAPEKGNVMNHGVRFGSFPKTPTSLLFQQ